MRKQELEKFKEALLDRKHQMIQDVDKMTDEVLMRSPDESRGDFNHMADMGSDNFDQDFTIGLMEKEQEELREIDAALERIGDGSFGTCTECEKKIGTERLKAIPYARLCIACKTAEEKEEGFSTA